MFRRLTAFFISAVFLLLISCDSEIKDSEQGLTDLTEEPAVTAIADVTETPTATPVTAVNTTADATSEPVKSLPSTTMVEYISVLSTSFSNGSGDFMPRGGAEVSVVDNEAYEGDFCLKVTNRTATWNGAMIDMSGIMEDEKRFSLTTWVKYDEGFDSITISVMLERNGNEYLGIGSVLVKKGEWTKLEGDIVVPPGTQKAVVYFETQWKPEFVQEDLCDFYIGKVEILEEIVQTSEVDIPALKDAYKDYFYVGSGIEPSDLNIPEIKDIIVKHFDTLTCGNEMKPDYLLDYEKSISDPKYDTSPAVKFDRANIIMDFAAEYSKKVRGHTLLWHAQTPRWLFTVGYSKKTDAEFVDREIMLLRMENYIKQVLEYFQTKYPDIIFAWDVVNEAIEIADKHPKGYRTKESLWYEVVGDDYIIKAFEYARKYADPNVKLFYNDYNTFISDRTFAMCNLLTELKEKGLVDGIGMQSHIGVDSPSLTTFEDAMRKFFKVGVEVHITELDMGMDSNDDEALLMQGRRYGRLGTVLKFLHKEELPITSLTVWGIIDNRSWLNTEGPRYPLLFDKYFNPKLAFWGLIDPSIVENY